MNLRTFVTETLKEVIGAVRDAQQADGGTAINAEVKIGGELGGNLINAGVAGVFTRVDFDIGISAEGELGAGGGLTVFNGGVKGGGKRKSGYANRISFSVPIRLPDGTPAPKTRYEGQPIPYPNTGVV